MSIDTASTKEQMIQQLQGINVFIANNQGNINSKKLAMVQDSFEGLENRMRTAFSEDDKMSTILADFEKEVEEQEKYIEKQKNRIKNMENLNDENSSSSFDDSDLPPDILRYEK